VNVAVMILPNILLQVFWIISMCKVCGILREFFELQTKTIYSSKGIQWVSFKHLMFIGIRIADPEAWASRISSRSSQPSQVGKADSLRALDDSNKRSLLKGYQA